MAYIKLLLFVAVLSIAAVTAEEEKQQDLEESESGVHYSVRHGYNGYPRHWDYGRAPGYRYSTRGPAYRYSRFVLGHNHGNRYDHDNYWHGDDRQRGHGLGYGRHCHGYGYGNPSYCRYGGYGRRYGGYDRYGRRYGGYGGYARRYGYSPYGRRSGYRYY